MKRELENTEEDKIQKVESLLNQNGTELKRIAYLYVKDHSLTEDILQEVFISCFKQMDYFREESSYKTRLIKITINKCKDALKRWSFRNIIYKENLDSSLVETRTPELHTVSKIEDIHLAKHILALPIKFREVIILYYYQDLSIEEISLILDVKNSTVKTRLHRARTKLRKKYELKSIVWNLSWRTTLAC